MHHLSLYATARRHARAEVAADRRDDEAAVTLLAAQLYQAMRTLEPEACQWRIKLIDRRVARRCGRA